MGRGTLKIIVSAAAILLGGALAAEDPDAAFLRGDCNRDGERNIGDPIATLQFLFGRGTLTCLDAADANDDGEVNIADPITMLAYLFGPQKVLPPPDVEPAADPTPDALACDEAPEIVTLAFAPRQCVSYPWELLGERDELEGLRAWVESMGGVVEDVRKERWDVMVCMACVVCARGYSLIITLSGDEAIAELMKIGFGPLGPWVGPAVDAVAD